MLEPFGAGAVVVEASDKPGILATDLHADGRHVGILCTPGTVNRGQILGDPTLKMDGQAVFKMAVRVLEEAARAALGKANATEADIDYAVNLLQGKIGKLRDLSPLWEMYKDGVDLNSIQWAAH